MILLSNYLKNYDFFYILALLLITFCFLLIINGFSERFKFTVSKLTQLHRKILMRKNTSDLKLKNLRFLKELFSSYYYVFLGIF